MRFFLPDLFCICTSVKSLFRYVGSISFPSFITMIYFLFFHFFHELRRDSSSTLAVLSPLLQQLG